MEATLIRRTVELEDRHWWFRERRAIVGRQLRRFEPGRALDLGGAGGGNARVLIEHGWDALVADQSETAVEFARERGLRAVQADACDLPLPDRDFDLVLAFDVLEHIENDHRALCEIVRVLRPGAVALIAVPCDMALWSSHDVAAGHHRRYTRTGLCALLNGGGLVVDRVWSWNVLMRPIVALRRRNQTGSDLTELPPVVNATLGAVVAAERYLPVGSLPGVSLMVRAHRPL
ncbi:class I SAM-dependent methyltransferase [Sphaerisporangium corydalis]|uniref:Class I SAM-dependent methyltransferase n=1 Tax=Sphaerisporangium corydalis TaxID=1441875 RepID=A0ABV9ELE9_9ACTN|nr:class I SAM-dependent methyltransferase [Sphaerisporangium corydalis]